LPRYIPRSSPVPRRNPICPTQPSSLLFHSPWIYDNPYFDTSCTISFYELTSYGYTYKYFWHVFLYSILDIKVVSVLTLSSHSSQFSSTHTNSSQTSPPSPKAIYAKYSLTLVKANIKLHSASRRILRRTYAINPTPIPQRSSPIPTLRVILLPSPTLSPLDLRRPSVSFTFADPRSSRPSPTLSLLYLRRPSVLSTFADPQSSLPSPTLGPLDLRRPPTPILFQIALLLQNSYLPVVTIAESRLYLILASESRTDPNTTTLVRNTALLICWWLVLIVAH
jgi:hypothetical protein